MRFLLSFLVLGTVLLAVTQPLSAQAAAGKPVLLILIDGLRPADTLDAQHRGLHLPTLQAFPSHGTCAHDVRGALPTLPKLMGASLPQAQ